LFFASLRFCGKAFFWEGVVTQDDKITAGDESTQPDFTGRDEERMPVPQDASSLLPFASTD
jgi:hypothetical protein